MSNDRPDNPRFDTRTQQLDLRRGALTKEQLAEHLASLPDEAEHAVTSDVRFVGSWGRRSRSR